MEILLLSLLLIFTLFWAFSSMGLVRFPRRKKTLPPEKPRRSIFKRPPAQSMDETPEKPRQSIFKRPPAMDRKEWYDPSDQYEFIKLLENRKTNLTISKNNFYWKLHLEYRSPKAYDRRMDARVTYHLTEKDEQYLSQKYSGDPLYDFLLERGYDWKKSPFTIYIGSKDDAKALADELIQKFGKYLSSILSPDMVPLDRIKNTEDPYLCCDTVFDNEGKIIGRFSGTGEEYHTARKGFDGLPFLTRPAEVHKEYEEIIYHYGNASGFGSHFWEFKKNSIERYGSEIATFQALTQVMDKTYRYLEREFGTFFTGTGSNKQIGYYPGKYFK